MLLHRRRVWISVEMYGCTVCFMKIWIQTSTRGRETRYILSIMYSTSNSHVMYTREFLGCYFSCHFVVVFFLQGVVIVLNKRSSMWNVRMRIKRVKIDRVCRQRQTGRRKRWIGAVSESDSFFFVFSFLFFLVVDVFEPSYVNRGWKMEVKDGRRIRARTLEKMRSFEHSRRKHDHTVHTQKGTREERDNSNVTGKGARGRKWAYLVKARHSLYG